MRKVILITGASSGMGASAAKIFAKKGYIVYAVARRLERMEHLKKMGIIIRYMDVTDTDSVRRVLDEIIKKHKKIDVLVNNAGYGSFGPVEHVDIEEAKSQFEVNVFAVGRLVQMVVPYMKQKNRGTIINMSSVCGQIILPLGGWYDASKHALNALNDNLRYELSQFGIRVICIAPGDVKSEWCGIMEEKLNQTSKNTDYEQMAFSYRKFMVESGKHAKSPERVAGIIYRACESKCPRKYYTTSAGMALVLGAERILPVTAFDMLLKLVMKFMILLVRK